MAIPNLAPNYLSQVYATRARTKELAKDRALRNKMQKDASNMQLRNALVGGVTETLLGIAGKELQEAIGGKREAIKSMKGPAALKRAQNLRRFQGGAGDQTRGTVEQAIMQGVFGDAPRLELESTDPFELYQATYAPLMGRRDLTSFK